MAVNKDFVVKNGLQVGANTSIEGSITTVDSVQFDANAAITATAGQLAWNADYGTLDLGLNTDVTLQLGQETHVFVKAGEAITDGDVVYASAAVGNSGKIEVSKYIANNTIEERRVVGVATESIASGEFGYVTAFGKISGVSTDGSTAGGVSGAETWNEGDILYASPYTAGKLTNVQPEAPNQAIAIAFVLSKNASNGVLMCRAYDLGYHLSELHDVHITSVANNDILIWDNNRWVNSANASISLGNLTVTGDLTVTGNTTSVNSNNLTIEDLNIVLANGAANSSVADGAGITIDGANAQITYDGTNNEWDFNTNITVTSQSNEAYIDLFDSGGSHSQIGGGTYGAYGNSKISFRTQEDSGSLTTKMVIIDDGKVGIGALNPTEKLHLSGGKLLINNGGSLYIDSDAAQAVLATTGNRLLRFETNSTNRLVISGSTGDATFSANVSAANMSATTIDATTLNATTLNGAFGNTAVQVASAYPVTPATGNIWFDNLNLKLKVFDGSNWQDAVPSGGGSSANSASTDANATFAKYTYVLGSATSVVSGQDVNSNTLSYDTSGIENVEVYVNGVKQVEGLSYDYTATTGTSIGFTTTLSAGDVVDVQVYELLTNDAFVLKAGGAFEGTVEFTNTSISQTFTNASLAHGMTLIADTDEFLRINREAADGNGGVRLSALTDGTTAFNVSAYSGTASTNQDKAVIRLRGAKANGTSEQPLANTEILYTLGNTGTEVHVVRGDGHTTFNGNGGSGAQLVFDQWGTIAQKYNSNQVASFSWTGTGDSNIQQYATGVLKNRFDAAGNSYITGGNLGVGTSGPSAKLEINIDDDAEYSTTEASELNPVGTDALYIHNTENTSTYGKVSILMRSTGSGGGAAGRITLKNNRSGSGAFAWLLRDNGHSSEQQEKMELDSDGNLKVTGHFRLAGEASSIPGDGGIARLSNGYTYFSGKNDGNGTVLSNGDGTATIRAMNPGATAGYIDIETGNGAHVIQIDTNGNFIPQTTDQDLGSTANPWQNIYTQDLVLSNESRETGNDIDGTKGNWTVQEGEDHLYLINNKNGKKYRFALEEIE